MGEPKRKIATIRIASMLLLLAISVLALAGCGGEEEKGGGETTSAGGVTTAELAVANVSLTPSRDSGVVGNANITDTPAG